MAAVRTDERRERDRVRQQIHRAHRRGDHSRCRDNCGQPFDFSPPGAIPEARNCKAGALAFIDPHTCTREEYYRREVVPVHHVLHAVPTHSVDGFQLDLDARWQGARD